MIVSIPVGNQNTNILQRASARSSIRMTGRNQRWTFRSRHPDKKLLIAINSPNTSAAQTDQALHLAHDLSFILQRTQIQTGECDDVEVSVAEKCKYQGKQVPIKDTIVVKKQKCDWVQLN